MSEKFIVCDTFGKSNAQIGSTFSEAYSHHQAAELSRYFLVEGQKISNRLIFVIESIYKANSGFKEIL